MTSYLTCMGENFSVFDVNSLVETINPLKTLNTKILNVDQGFFAVSFHQKAPLKGNKYFNNKDWTAVFAGDLIEKSIPWNFILKSFKKKEYSMLNNLRGYFSITVLDKKTNKLFIVSDRRSQFPVFYLMDGKNAYISTELSTFCRLPLKVSFNIEWMWEYLFFHYPIGQTTFLENVNRMPPACVLELNIKSGEHLISEYTAKFQKKKHLLKGEKALEHAYGVFKNRVPKYFTGTEDIACALTGGWDSRTNLLFCPNKTSIMTYTYGIPGCWDLVESSEIVQAMDIEHRKILFDKNFENELPSLIIDAIYLSSGLERLRRSAPLYVYKNLTDFGQKNHLLIEGIDYDGLFRGHADPALVSRDMARIFSTGEKTINERYWMGYIGNHYGSFKRHILKKIDSLEKQYGNLFKPETHLSYSLYETSPKYWAGQLSFAKHFTTLRIPAWDTDIIDLSYSIENSTLLFSEFLRDHKRGSWKELILQAYLISKDSGPLKEIPVGGVPPKTVLKGKIVYHITRIKYLLLKAIKMRGQGKSYTPENWGRWLNEVQREFIDNLIFSENSRIRKYIEDKVLEKLKDKRDIQLISKFASIEIILRLIENSWKRFEGF